MDKQQKIEILQDLVRIPSENDHERQVAEYIKNLFAEYGIESEIIPYSDTRANLVAELKGEEVGPILAFSGHFDVVAAGNHDDWSVPPFDAVIEGDTMIGRGTSDMKMGVAAMIIAMIELKESGAQFPGAIRFLGTVGEEIGMLGAQQLAKAGYVDDIDALLISEPSSKTIHTSHKGSLQFKVVSTGKSAHSSTPEEGINSIIPIVQFISRAEKVMQKAHEQYENKQLGRLSNSFTVIDGGDQINSIPAHTTLLGNTRTIPEYDNDRVIADFTAIATEIQAEFDGKIEFIPTQSAGPVAAPTDSKLVQSILKHMGSETPIVPLTGATDASMLLKDHPDAEFAIIGLADLKWAHKVDEQISVSDYLASIDLYQEIAKSYLLSK